MHYGIFYTGRCGRLGIEDLDEDTGSGRSVRFAHDVLDVLFDRLLSNLKGISNFLICPSLSQVFHDGLFTIGELELLLRLVGIELLSSPELF